MKPIELAKPGDVLVYRSNDLVGRLIWLRTWHNITHVELYIGAGQSIGSRVADGVNLYPAREDGLVGIYRPTGKVEFGRGMAWFRAVKGQGYDFKGLLALTWLGVAFRVQDWEDRMFCSEFLCRWFRRAQYDLFPGEDADLVAPFQFTVNPLLKEVYLRRD